jgi:hypothetical protein
LVFYDAVGRPGQRTGIDGQKVAPVEAAGSTRRRSARKANEMRIQCTGKTGQFIGRLDKK